MPGLRSLVARRRSSLASPQYSSVSKTPPPYLPSTSDVVYNAQKIERRCNSLPGQVSSEVSEEDLRPADLQDHTPDILNGLNNISHQESEHSCSNEGQNVKPKVSCSSNVNNVAVGIESTLAKRGVTVVRRMVDVDELSKASKSDLRSFSLKDTVITANPLITKEVSKPNLDGASAQSVTVQKSVLLKPANLQQQPVLGTQNEPHKQSQVREFLEKSEGSYTKPHPETVSSHSQPVCETQTSISSSFSSQSITIVRETASSNSSQRYSTQSYYSQFVHQQSPKETAGQSSSSVSFEYLSSKGTSVTNMHGSFKSDSSGIPVPPSQTLLPLRSGVRCSPQAISSYQQSKSVGQIAQYGQTPSPLSKSSEISPQPISAEMSPYSRSAEASPASRNAQQSPQSRSSQISPLSRSVKVSPQARTAELSPQSVTQMSPSIRSGEVSPQSRYVGMSPHSGSVESPQSRSSGLLSPSVSSGHKNTTTPVVSQSPSHPLEQSHPQGTERHMAQALPTSHTSHPVSVNNVQPDNQGRLLPGPGAASFPNIPVSDFLGRSGADANLYPSCNPSGVLSPQRDSAGYSSHLNSRSFSLHSTHGSYAAQSSSITYPSPSSGYPQGANSAHFSGVPGGMVSNPNAMAFGNFSNCGGGFPLHSGSGIYPSHPSHGTYNLHSNSGNLRSPNTSGSLNYSGSRGEFAMHTPYRDYPLYSSSNEVPNTLRSPEGPLQNQRDIYTDHRPRESSLQNSHPIMSLNPSGRDSSINPMGREPHLQRNYSDQPMMSPYRESSVLQRSNSSSLPGARDSTLQQNYGDHTSSYKTDLHSSTYRVPQQNDMRSNSTSTSYRDLPVLPSNNDYHSQSHIAGANTVSSFRDQSISVGYREQNMMNNYLSSPEVPITTNFREHASHSGIREQVVNSYQGVLNHMSPAENASSVSTYQDSRSVPTASSQIHPSYSETLNHTGREHLASRYRDTVSHTSPGEQTPTYGESATCTNSGGITPGYQEMRGQVNSAEHCLANYEGMVNQRMSREQVMTGFSHTTSHTSPRHQAHQSFKGSVNQTAAVEQSLASYQGNVNHSSPKEQPYPTFQEDRSFREDDHRSPRQPLQSFVQTINHTDSKKINSDFGPNTDQVHPRENLHSRFKDSEEYHSMISTLDQRGSEESCTNRIIPNYVHGSEEAMNSNSYHRNSVADNYEGMQGLQNFRVHSQQKSPVAAGGTCAETHALPSFTEFFEKASHKSGNPKSSYRAVGENAVYSDSKNSLNPQDCEAKAHETVSPCSSNRDEYVDSVESEKVNYDEFGDASNYEGTYVGSCDRDIHYCNESRFQCNSEFKDTPNELDSQVCKSPVKLDPKVNGMEYISSPTAQFIAESNKSTIELPASSSQRYSAGGASSSTNKQDDDHTEASSLTSSSGVKEELVSVEKIDSGDSTGKPSTGTSPSSQERIVIKMKLLHSEPDDAEDYRSGRHSGSKDGKSDRGNLVRFPMVKYTRWTIDSIINGREVEGGAEILGQDKNKRQSDLKDVYEYDSDRLSVKSPKRSRKRRSSETWDSSKVNKFDTNKNLMKKSLKITITNPLRARFSPDSKPLNVKSEYVENVMKQNLIEQYDHLTSVGEAEKPERITSSLRKIRIEQHKSNRSPSPRLNVDGQLSSSSSTCSSLNSRRQKSHGSTASEGSASESCSLTDRSNSSITRLKKCSIVIKRIYTDDNSSCYRSSFSKKNTRNSDHSEDGICSPNKLMSRPKRKAAIEANERRHKSMKSFDRSLDLSNRLTSEKVPYKGPSNRYKTYVPLVDLTVGDDPTQKIDSVRDLSTLEQNGSITESSSKNSIQNTMSDSITEVSKQNKESDSDTNNLKQMSESTLPIDSSKQHTAPASAFENPDIDSSKQHTPPASTFENPDTLSDVAADSSENIIVLDFPAEIPEHNINPLASTKSSEEKKDSKSSDRNFEPNVMAVVSSENSEQDLKSELSRQTSEHNLEAESTTEFSEDIALDSNTSTLEEKASDATATVSEETSVTSLTAESLNQQIASDSCTEHLEGCAVLDSDSKSTEELQFSDLSAKICNRKKVSGTITENIKSDSSIRSSKRLKAPRSSTKSTRQSRASDLSTRRSKKPVSNSPATRTKNKIVSKSPCKSSKPNKVLDSRTKSSIKKIASDKRSRHSKKKKTLSGLLAKSQKQNGVLSPCKVLLCDIFMNRRINKMKCPGCTRNYDSTDSVQVNMKRCTISFLCCHCKWLVVKDIQPCEVEAMAPR